MPESQIQFGRRPMIGRLICFAPRPDERKNTSADYRTAADVDLRLSPVDHQRLMFAGLWQYVQGSVSTNDPRCARFVTILYRYFIMDWSPPLVNITWPVSRLVLHHLDIMIRPNGRGANNFYYYMYMPGLVQWENTANHAEELILSNVKHIQVWLSFFHILVWFAIRELSIIILRIILVKYIFYHAQVFSQRPSTIKFWVRRLFFCSK